MIRHKLGNTFIYQSSVFQPLERRVVPAGGWPGGTTGHVYEQWGQAAPPESEIAAKYILNMLNMEEQEKKGKTEKEKKKL